MNEKAKWLQKSSLMQEKRRNKTICKRVRHARKIGEDN